MKKYTVKHLITSALLSLTPGSGLRPAEPAFRLMDWLDPTQMKLVFATEFVLYITVLAGDHPQGKEIGCQKSRLCPQTAPPRPAGTARRHRPPPGFHHHCGRRPHCRLKQNML